MGPIANRIPYPSSNKHTIYKLYNIKYGSSSLDLLIIPSIDPHYSSVPMNRSHPSHRVPIQVLVHEQDIFWGSRSLIHNPQWVVWITDTESPNTIGSEYTCMFWTTNRLPTLSMSCDNLVLLKMTCVHTLKLPWHVYGGDRDVFVHKLNASLKNSKNRMTMR